MLQSNERAICYRRALHTVTLRQWKRRSMMYNCSRRLRLILWNSGSRKNEYRKLNGAGLLHRSAHLSATNDPETLAAIFLWKSRHRLLSTTPPCAIVDFVGMKHVSRLLIFQLNQAATSDLFV